MIRKYIRIEKGVTLIELIIVLALLSIVTITIFRVLFFGMGTYASGKMQYDIQSDIRFASDVIRDRVRYVSDLDVIPLDPSDPFFDVASADINFNYIYLSDDEKSIKFKEVGQNPVDIINSGSSDVLFELEFIKGSNKGNVIRFSNSIAGMSSVDQILQYNIFGESLQESKQYEVQTKVTLLNLNSQLPDFSYIVGPIATPPEGEVTSGTTVSLTTAETGAVIYYTTDGSNPSTSSDKYVSPISITSLTTIKAIVVKDGISSSVAMYEYSILVAPPVATSVLITGTAKEDQILTVEYTYSSATNPIQGKSYIKWYRSDKKTNNTDELTTLIHSDTFTNGVDSTRQYKLTSFDVGNYIYVEIIPVDTNGTGGLSAWDLNFSTKIQKK